MGAWGDGAFMNDDALDWVGDLTSGQGRKALAASLAAVAEAGDEQYVEAPDASTAIAAAEVVAAAAGKPAKDLPEDVVEWIESEGFVPPAELIALACRAVARVRENSELRELWDESGDAAWSEATAELERRLLSL